MQYEKTVEAKKTNKQNRAKRFLMNHRVGICDKEDVRNVSKEVHSTCNQ